MLYYLVRNMGWIKSQKTILLIRGLTESTGQSYDVSNPAPCRKTYNTVSAMWTCEQLRYVLHVCLATCRIISAAASKPHANPTTWIFNWIIQQIDLKQVPDGFMDSETVCTSSFCNQTLASRPMSSYGLWGLQWRLFTCMNCGQPNWRSINWKRNGRKWSAAIYGNTPLFWSPKQPFLTYSITSARE
jgi:hypothetical protein